MPNDTKERDQGKGKVAADGPQKRAATPSRKKPRGKKVSQGAKVGRAPQAKYPRHTVTQALRIPEAILEQNAGRPCSVKEAASFLGIKAHGPFRVEMSSSKKYGLLLSQGTSQVKPSDLARKILRPQTETDEIDGLREAVMQAPDFAEVYAHYRGENLPDLQFLRNTVAETYQVPAEKFEEFYDVFVDSLRAANLLEEHGDKRRVLDVTTKPVEIEGRSERIKRLEKAVTVEASATCFVMQPFAAPFGDYYEKLYKPAIEKAGLGPVRADADIFGTGKIMDQVWRGINAAQVLVAELTSRNPNVFYELGMAHALEKPVVLVSSNEEDVPFDLHHIRVIYYDKSDPFWGSKLIEKVAENILSAIRNPEEAIFRATEIFRRVE